MRRVISLLAAFVLFPLATFAQDVDTDIFRLGDDYFLAGSSVTLDAGGTHDAFLVGETARLAAPITGTAHLVARRVAVASAVGQNFYGAGMEVDISAPVEGNATVAGYTVSVRAAIGGNLRATGANLTVTAPVGGTALLTGERVEIAAPITGDVAVAVRYLSFSEGARIDGTLRLYARNPDAIEVPASVIPPERVTRYKSEGFEGMEARTLTPDWRILILRYLVGALMVAAIAALIAAVAPGPLAAMRRRLLARPFGTLGWGFLALSALIGSSVVIAFTLIGLLISPAMLVLALIAGAAGYIIGAYSFGVGIFLLFRPEPDSPGTRALAALIGALTAALLALIPFLGWLFVLTLTLAGLGALVLSLLRPSFYTAPAAE